MNVSYMWDTTVLRKFRCNDQTLLIKLGRHKGLPVEQRLCKICQLNLLEDEFHFLIIYSEYEDLRAGLLSAANVELLDPKLKFSSFPTLRVVKALQLLDAWLICY